MVTVVGLRLPATWVTAASDNPAFDISANELDDDLTVVADLDFGTFDLKCPDISVTNLKSNDGITSHSIADGTGVLTMSANFNIAGFNIINTGTLTLPTSTDTLVGRATVDTLTNKTLTSPVLTTPQVNDASLTDQFIFAGAELAADRTVTLPALTGGDTFVFEAHTQTLTNKTLTSPVITSPVLTTPQINDTSSDHQYVFVVSELVADRNVTLPLLAGDDTFVFQSHIQTLTNKTLTSAVLTTPQLNDTSLDHQYVFVPSELTADRNVTWPLLTGDDTLVFQAHIQTLTNKTLTAPVITSPVLTTPQINDTSSDHQYVFAVSELTADRNVTLPLLTGDDTFVFLAHTQTLTNKTLTAPVIATIVNSGTLTLPTSTDTLVGRATADTLTNKTLSTGTVFSVIPTINDGITFTFNPSATVSGLNFGALAGDISSPVNGDVWYNSTTNKFRGRENGINVDVVGAGSTAPFNDNVAILKDSGDPTKLLLIDVDNISTGTTRTYDVSNADGILRVNRPNWTYLIEKSGSNYVAWKNTGAQVSSNTDLKTVYDAVLSDKGASNPAIIEFTEGSFTWVTKPTTANHQNLTIRGQGMGVTKWIVDSSIAASNPVFTFNKSGALVYYAISTPAYGAVILTLTTGADESNFAIGNWLNIISDNVIDTASASRENGIFARCSDLAGGGSGTINLYGSVNESSLSTSPRVAVLAFIENLTIQDLEILDQRASAGAEFGGNVLDITHHLNVTIQNIRFTDCRRGCVEINRSNFIRISGCDANRSLQFDHSLITGESSMADEGAGFNYGFKLDNCENGSISGNTGHYSRHFVSLTCAGATDDTQGRCRNISVTGNTFIDGITSHIDAGHEGVRDVTITGNTLIQNAEGITDNSAITARCPCIITGNICKSGFEGITIFNETGTGSVDPNPSIISNNDIEARSKGIFLRYDTADCIVSNNRIVVGSGDIGIDLERFDATTHAGDRCIISNNHLTGVASSTSVGIRADGSINTFVTGNIINTFVECLNLADTDTRTADWYISNNYFMNCTDGSPDVAGSNIKQFGNVENTGAKTIKGHINMFMASQTSDDSSTAVYYLAPVGQISVSTTETLKQNYLPIGIVVSEVYYYVPVNTKITTNGTAAFRDDTVDIAGGSVTITFGVTGTYQVTGLSVHIDTGSLISHRVTFSTTGNIRAYPTVLFREDL